MPKIKYIEKRFNTSSRILIGKANRILDEYHEQGYVLTLRQLYYQFVARDFLENTVQAYKRLGSVINDARLAGHIDWSRMEDRTRNLVANSHWGSPEQILRSCADQYERDKWEGQEYHVEIWIEKEALFGVIDGTCAELDVPRFACRGYVSQSEMWGASRRLASYERNGRHPVILHFGDHDPSGVDMTRDIEDRLRVFNVAADVHRVALNMDQVEEYDPPPNPAKITDSRAPDYIRKYGADSWELDALEPSKINELIEDFVSQHRDDELWEAEAAIEAEHREALSLVADHWAPAVKFVKRSKKGKKRKK